MLSTNGQDKQRRDSLIEVKSEEDFNEQSKNFPTVLTYLNDPRFLPQLIIEAIKEGGLLAKDHSLNEEYNALVKWFLEIGKSAEIIQLQANLAVDQGKSSQLLDNLRARFLFQIQKEITGNMHAFLKSLSTPKEGRKERLSEISSAMAQHYEIISQKLNGGNAQNEDALIINYMLQAIIKDAIAGNINDLRTYLEVKNFFYEIQEEGQDKKEYVREYIDKEIKRLKRSIAKTWGFNSSETIDEFLDAEFSEDNETFTLKFQRLLLIAKRPVINEGHGYLLSKTKILQLCDGANKRYEDLLNKYRNEYDTLEFSRAEDNERVSELIKNMKEKFASHDKRSRVITLMRRVFFLITKNVSFTAQQIDETIEGYFDEILHAKKFSVNARCLELHTGSSFPLIAKQYQNQAIYELFANHKRGKAALIIENFCDEAAVNYQETAYSDDDLKLQYQKCRRALREIERKLLDYLRRLVIQQNKKTDVYLLDREREANRYLILIQQTLLSNNMSNVLSEIDAILNDPNIIKGNEIANFLFKPISLWRELHPMMQKSLKELREKNYALLQKGINMPLLQERDTLIADSIISHGSVNSPRSAISHSPAISPRSTISYSSANSPRLAIFHSSANSLCLAISHSLANSPRLAISPCSVSFHSSANFSSPHLTTFHNEEKASNEGKSSIPKLQIPPHSAIFHNEEKIPNEPKSSILGNSQGLFAESIVIKRTRIRRSLSDDNQLNFKM